MTDGAADTGAAGHCAGVDGDELVCGALGRKWRRYHDTHCGCGLNWVTEHAEPAGFTVVRAASGWVVLVGPGLTEGVDKSSLTANALWEAVTGKPGEGWVETPHVIDRSEAAEKPSPADPPITPCATNVPHPTRRDDRARPTNDALPYLTAHLSEVSMKLPMIGGHTQP
ncbi:hypothetical protein [Streptomyces sp. NPDC002553]|uniref:hypothetical protein n=1 Tax=Streptomyces sp. NPDC002553 TaxID=3154417 RepID=UPI00332403E7